MPTFNRAGLLERALASVLQQHDPDWELLVADDGSDDGTPGLLARWRTREPRVRSWRHNNRGQAASRNRLIGLARAPWIAFLDSDDELEPRHLGRHRAAIRANPSVDVWQSPMRVVGSQTVPCANIPGADIHLDDCIGVGMLVIRRTTLVAAGGFPDVSYAEETALMQRLVAQGAQRGHLPDRSYVYHRSHAESLTRAKERLPLPEGYLPTAARMAELMDPG
ncbi:glycosyltransferase family 2 protein [Arenimonas alkanexedens]